MKKNIIISIVIISLLITVIYSVNHILNKVNHITIDKSDEALGISSEEKKNVHEESKVKKPVRKEREDIINIVLFGLDSKKSVKYSRSDTMIILTLDFKNKKIKLSSLMRDMYVNIEGYGNTKLNHAYAYGGSPLAMKTINQNFGTDIRDYAAANFDALEKIVDILGGVVIDIKQEEIPYINKNISCSEKDITHDGVQLLTGNQAVAYARIRYVGNGDFERTERQRKILSVIINKAKLKGLSSAPALISEILPLVETSLDKHTILNLAFDYFKAGEMYFEQQRFPVDEYSWNDNIDGIYYLKFDCEKTKHQIVDYIYNDIKPGQNIVINSIKKRGRTNK